MKNSKRDESLKEKYLKNPHYFHDEKAIWFYAHELVNETGCAAN